MLVRALKIQLTGPGTLVGALNALLTQKWAASVVNGQTVLSTSEAGGSVTFTFERAQTPAELAVMAEEALEWVNTLADPESLQMSVARRPLSPTNRSGISRPKPCRIAPGCCPRLGRFLGCGRIRPPLADANRGAVRMKLRDGGPRWCQRRGNRSETKPKV
jgi:hypothetical protein